jgi:LacI family transcriptional regulator
MEKRVTIYTISEKLGISATTVYRALNNKPRINEKTKNAVLRAAEELGFKPNTLAKGLARKALRFAVFIMTGFPEFQNYILRGIKQTEEELYDFNVHVDYFVYGDEAVTEEARRYRSEAFKKIALSGYDAVLSTSGTAEEFTLLEEKNIPVALIINEIPGLRRKFCVQHDSHTAGRMAAELLYWKLGKDAVVAIASGIPGLAVHEVKEKGFIAQLALTPLCLRKICYNQDSHDLAYRQTKALLEENPDIKGIYINSFNSLGVVEAVRDAGLDGDICIVASDISAQIKEYLAKGVVTATIFQNQYRQGQLGLRYLYRAVAENAAPDEMTIIKPEAVFNSNMHFYE